MSPETVTALQNAFKVDPLINTFVSFAPWILGIIGAIMVVGLVKSGIRTLRARLSRGVA